MPSDLPKNITKLAAALLKHQAKLWLGEEVMDIAGDTLIEIGGDQLQEKIDSFLATQEGSRELLNAASRADAYFRQNCDDDELRQAFSLSFGDLPSVQEVVADLPEAMDASEVEQAIQAALERDIHSLTPTQITSGASLYTESLQRALLPIKEFTLPIIGQTVLDIKSKLAQLNAAQEEIKAGQARIEKRLSGLSVAPGLWLPPSAPRLNKPMIGRRTEFKALKKMLKPGKTTAITATVQGVAGVGKTMLAEYMAVQLAPLFPGGVIFQNIGSKFRDPILCNPILKQWAGYAFGGKAPDDLQPNSDEVRSLLSGHGSILIVLDDIWSIKVVEPLLAALPQEACLLVSTRSRRIAQELHGAVYALDVLSPDDALALLRSRLPVAEKEDIGLLKELANGLGFHAQALDIAAGSLARQPKLRWKSAVQTMLQQVVEGSGFGEIHLPGDEESESHVEAALSTSYHDLPAEAQTRFCQLGAFAPDSSFRGEAIAGVWECTLEAAEAQLLSFAELGLLNQLSSANGDLRWQQHGLLRAYALALLHRAGAEIQVRTRHAQAHNELMQRADDQQIYFHMLADYAQLRYAFDWAIEYDLELAFKLAANTANLQATFYLVRDNYNWAQRLLIAARKNNMDSSIARAQGSLANALARLANLPDEDRRARLLEALAAYDAALQFRRPDTAPLTYAVTQFNLCNLHAAFIGISEEDERAHYRNALLCAVTALSIFLQVGHAPYTQQAARQLQWLSERAGPLFAELWSELNLGEMPEWLK